MVCSLCKGTGHNKRTCPNPKTFLVPSVQSSPKQKSPAKKKGLTKKKATFERVAVVSSLQAEEKLAILKEQRFEQYTIAVDVVKSLTFELDDGTIGKNCSIKAEEKTGKRQIMEAIHLFTAVNHDCGVLPSKCLPKSVYVTALNRKDTKDQFTEQEDEFGILSIVATQHVELVSEITMLLKDPSHDGVIYIHLDECDYGTGSSQSLSKIWDAPDLNLPENKSRIKYITYSATPEEMEKSSTGKSVDWDFHTFTPSKDYQGAKWYIDENLVFPPTAFFDGTSDFTEQGIELIRGVNEVCSAEGEIQLRMRNVIDESSDY